MRLSSEDNEYGLGDILGFMWVIRVAHRDRMHQIDVTPHQLSE